MNIHILHIMIFYARETRVKPSHSERASEKERERVRAVEENTRTYQNNREIK